MGNTMSDDLRQAIGSVVQIQHRRFKILRLLGDGGFSYVFEVVDQITHKHYALKRMLAQDSESEAVAETEIRVLKQCQSENIIQYKALSQISHKKESGRRSFSEYMLLIEYCPGGTLYDFIECQEAPLDEERVLTIFLDCVRAVKVLHLQKPPICHRDLKLENLILSVNKKWKLCDFGSCTTRRQAYKSKEDIGKEADRISMYTTQSYRAPEMVDLWLRQVVGPPADIWALGCILYSLAFLSHPFQGASSLTMTNDRVKFPSRTNDHSKAFMNILKQTFKMNPDKRPTIIDLETLVLKILSGQDTPVDHAISKSHIKQKKRRKSKQRSVDRVEDIDIESETATNMLQQRKPNKPNTNRRSSSSTKQLKAKKKSVKNEGKSIAQATSNVSVPTTQTFFTDFEACGDTFTTANDWVSFDAPSSVASVPTSSLNDDSSLLDLMNNISMQDNNTLMNTSCNANTYTATSFDPLNNQSMTNSNTTSQQRHSAVFAAAAVSSSSSIQTPSSSHDMSNQISSFMPNALMMPQASTQSLHTSQHEQVYPASPFALAPQQQQQQQQQQQIFPSSQQPQYPLMNVSSY